VGVLFTALREDKMSQTWLMPRNVTEFIQEDHICHLVTALADGLDVNSGRENTVVHKINQRIHVKCCLDCC